MPDALRAAGLPEFVPSAEKALAVHFPPPYPTTILEWAGAIEKIRDAQLEDEFDKSVYEAIENEFFALYHADPKHFRHRLGVYVLEHLED